MKIKTQKDRPKPQKGKKINKKWPKSFLSEFRPIMNCDADSKNVFKIIKNPKMKIKTQKTPQKPKKT